MLCMILLKMVFNIDIIVPLFNNKKGPHSLITLCVNVTAFNYIRDFLGFTVIPVPQCGCLRSDPMCVPTAQKIV